MRASALALLLVLFAACGGGDTCIRNSDCSGSAVCGADGVCLSTELAPDAATDDANDGDAPDDAGPGDAPDDGGTDDADLTDAPDDATPDAAIDAPTDAPTDADTNFELPTDVGPDRLTP
jgi:hypothetical protein